MNHIIEQGVPSPGLDTSPEARRRFLRTCGRLAAVAAVGGVASCGSDQSPLANYPTPAPSGTASPTPTPSPTIVKITDTDMLVLMQQLHYLQAEFYSRAVLAAPLSPALVGGSGASGDVTGARAVTFTDPVLADIVREIAAEKIDQVVKLRSVLGTATPARPAINLGVDDAGVFTQYGRNSKDVVAPALYDVYASQERFLLGAFILEDAVMVAWRGISAMMTDAVDVAAGLLATSAHHTAIIRAQLYIRGGATGSTLRQSSIRLSDLRDSYSPVDDDRGVAASSATDTATKATAADINPADGDGEIYGRLPNFTVNVFYMSSSAVTSGGFFPSGLNGNINTGATN